MLAVPALLAASARSFLTRPDVHGDLVAFTCEGDLWTGDLKTGTARRLTSDPGTETNARFSPDGATIAFTGNYDGGQDVYVMPAEGGAPKRLTYDPVGALVQGWTPDGKGVLFRSRRDTAVGNEDKLFVVPVDGGVAKALPVPRAEFGRIGPDGRLAYVPVSNEWMNWFDYRAGAADQVWLTDLKGGFRKLAASSGVETTPTWCGPRLFFVSERTGTRNLFRLDPASGKATAITQYADAPVRYPSADAHRVVFEHGAGLAVYDADTEKTTDLKFDLASDRIRGREMRFSLARYAMHPSLGPSGKRILMESRGQIVSVATEQGDLRVLEKKPGTRAMVPVWAPDGKRFAFVSDRSGEMEVWLGNAAGGDEPKPLTHGLAAEPFAPIWSPDGKRMALVDRDGRLRLIDATTGAITPVDVADIVGSYDNTNQGVAFSPDGKLLAFSHTGKAQLSSVILFEVATGKRVVLSVPSVNAYAPAFSADGKFVLYLADTQLTPSSTPITGKFGFDNPTRVYLQALANDTESPFLPKDEEEGAASAPAATPASPARVDWDGLADRRIETPIPAGRFGQVAHVPGKILLLNATSLPEVGGASPSELLSFDIEHKAMARVCDADGFEKSLDNKKIMVRRGAASVSVIDATSGPNAAAPISLAPYTLTVEPEQEWRQIFNESWRIARDFFYDPGMRGLDWNAIHRKYEARLPLVGDRTDLTRLLIDMVSELRTGHSYVVAPPAPVARIPMGFLGAVLAPEGNAAKIVKLYRGDGFSGDRSPLLEAGLRVKEGDYILAIAGQPVQKDQDPQALLIGLVNQTVAVMVNDKPTMQGARTIRIRPLASDRQLRYADWVQDRAEYVKRNGGADLGYAHIPDMVQGGLIGFAKGQYPNVNADGMVYDFRYNTGGYVSSLLLQDIASVPQLWFSPRAGGFWTRESWAVAGHKVALCNEENFSDGELVIEDWKRMNLGPVVGKRTGGGEVGSGGGYALVDGGSIYIPNYGAFGEKAWAIEGYGATPSVEVDEDPAAVVAGKDPQLDKAIALLKEAIAKNPVRRPVRPPFTKG